MKPNLPFVISASRRSDIPAFYMPWFMERIRQGIFESINPFNRRVAEVAVSPDRVHTIVFWSKDFGPFIKGRYGHVLRQMGYNIFFNFTINSADAILEPNIAPLAKRLKQLAYLSKHFGARTISWRFDPLCFYRTSRGTVKDNLSDFELIAASAADSGIQRCITSFMDHYPKIRKRVAAFPGFSFLDPPLEKKSKIILQLQDKLTSHRIELTACCEKELLAVLPRRTGIGSSSCIPNDLFISLFGGELSLKKDQGQRLQAGCGCKVSIDIGSYEHHPCYHNCLFCYANPQKRAGSQTEEKGKIC